MANEVTVGELDRRFKYLDDTMRHRFEKVEQSITEITTALHRVKLFGAILMGFVAAGSTLGSFLGKLIV